MLCISESKGELVCMIIIDSDCDSESFALLGVKDILHIKWDSNLISWFVFDYQC